MNWPFFNIASMYEAMATRPPRYDVGVINTCIDPPNPHNNIMLRELMAIAAREQRETRDPTRRMGQYGQLERDFADGFQAVPEQLRLPTLQNESYRYRGGDRVHKVDADYLRAGAIALGVRRAGFVFPRCRVDQRHSEAIVRVRADCPCGLGTSEFFWSVSAAAGRAPDPWQLEALENQYYGLAREHIDEDRAEGRWDG